MSKLQTTTQATRPSAPATGMLFHETDTNRLLLWDGSQYHVYNRDSISSPTTGVDDLHYPGGLYANTGANYYIASTPMFHMDASHVDGLVPTTGLSDGDEVLDWYDRTNSRYNMKSQRGYDGSSTTYRGKIDLVTSASISTNQCTAPAIKNDTHDKYNIDSTMPQSIPAQNTVFYVCAGPGNVSPLNNYVYWYRDPSGASVNYLRTFNGSSSSPIGFPSMPSTIVTGPSLFAGRQNTTELTIWDTILGGNGHTRNIQTSVNALDLSGGIMRSSYDMLMWEFMIFGSALSISEINTVKDYLQNKYAGLSDSLPTSGTTPALT